LGRKGFEARADDDPRQQPCDALRVGTRAVVVSPVELKAYEAPGTTGKPNRR